MSREVVRNGGRSEYRAHQADQAAWQRARRPQPCKLAENGALRAAVEEKLADWWSPQQISGWLRHTYPDVERMHVSHETIYLSLFIQARGGLKWELTQHLRTRRANHTAQGKKPPSGKGKIVDPVMISERPAEVEDRAVPGHWQGDTLDDPEDCDRAPPQPSCAVASGTARKRAAGGFWVSGLELRDKEKGAPTGAPPSWFRLCVVG